MMRDTLKFFLFAFAYLLIGVVVANILIYTTNNCCKQCLCFRLRVDVDERRGQFIVIVMAWPIVCLGSIIHFVYHTWCECMESAIIHGIKTDLVQIFNNVTDMLMFVKIK